MIPMVSNSGGPAHCQHKGKCLCAAGLVISEHTHTQLCEEVRTHFLGILFAFCLPSVCAGTLKCSKMSLLWSLLNSFFSLELLNYCNNETSFFRVKNAGRIGRPFSVMDFLTRFLCAFEGLPWQAHWRVAPHPLASSPLSLMSKVYWKARVWSLPSGGTGIQGLYCSHSKRHSYWRKLFFSL
jgi:hypothetical protein